MTENWILRDIENQIAQRNRKNITSKGKTLLIDNRAYIWFAVSKGTDSLDTVNQFLNSYNLK